MSGSPDFDLIVIGGGSGGLAGAFRAAQHGARVALLEPAALGGTCVNVGCVPKKAMWLAADLAHRIALSHQLGFVSADPHPVLDWNAFIVLRQRYIENIHRSYRTRLAESGIALFPSRGRLVSANEVETDDGLRLRAPQVLIATGGRPWVPDIEGAALALDSDGFFGLRTAPGRVALIGGGYIAVELAGVLQSLGSRVDLFVRRQQLLDGFDEDLVVRLAADMRQQGVRVHFGASVEALQRTADATIRLSTPAVSERDRYDAVIFATGRRPNTAGLGLAQVGIALTASDHIRIDARQATTVPGVHAVGDVTPQPALTPVAIAAARRLMDRLFGGDADACLDDTGIATVVFSHPPLGKIGLTEAQARQQYGDDVRIHRADFRPMLHALADSPQRSLFKLVCVEQQGDAPPAMRQRVVGLHLLGEAADEILQGFAVAMKRGITLADLHATMAIHPTSAEEIVLLR